MLTALIREVLKMEDESLETLRRDLAEFEAVMPRPDCLGLLVKACDLANEMVESSLDTTKPVVANTVERYCQRAITMAEEELTNSRSQHVQLLKQWMDVLDVFVEYGFGEEQNIRRVRRELDIEYSHSLGAFSLWDF